MLAKRFRLNSVPVIKSLVSRPKLDVIARASNVRRTFALSGFNIFRSNLIKLKGKTMFIFSVVYISEKTLTQ